MQSAFGTVVLVVCAVGLVGAIIALALGRRTWDEYGHDRLIADSDPRAGTGGHGSAQSTVTREDPREEEIRQLLTARNARRRRRGESELDVECELVRLTAAGAPRGDPALRVDDELRREIRDLVLARNHRRARWGEPPLDVEAEIERQLADLGRL